MTGRLQLAEVTAAPLGSLLGTTSSRCVHQRSIDLFAELTGDDQWIHTDPRRAGKGPYAATVAHGYLILALLPELTREVISFPAAGAVLNYGSDRIRFVSPIRAGSSFVDSIRLTALTHRAAGLLLGLEHTIASNATGAVHCVARTLTLVPPQ